MNVHVKTSCPFEQQINHALQMSQTLRAKFDRMLMEMHELKMERLNEQASSASFVRNSKEKS